jgi:hypothetical protein
LTAGSLSKRNFMPTPIEIHQEEPHVEPRPLTRRLWPKAVVVCAVIGGIYGATLGSVLATTAYAIAPIEIVATVSAVLGAFWASRIGSLFSILSRVRFTRLFLTSFSAVIAALVGVFPVLMALALPWSLGGAIVGWLAGRYNAHSWRRIAAEILGAVLGGCFGTVIFSMEQDQTVGRIGVLWGMGIGAVVGALLPLLFVKALNSFADEWIRMRERDGSADRTF